MYSIDDFAVRQNLFELFSMLSVLYKFVNYNLQLYLKFLIFYFDIYIQFVYNIRKLNEIHTLHSRLGGFTMSMTELINNFREDLHQIPELELDLPLTQSYILDKLISFGYEPFTIAKSGVIAFKKGSIGQKTYAFRADMDALPLTETSELSFKSKHSGRMHACGHDGHMAILLGLSKYVSDLDIKENILFIFQPGEESPGGAEIIVKSGLFDKYPVDAFFGLHLFPDVAEGKIAIKSGPQMAQCGELDVEIIGKSGHGAMPQSGHDALLAASELINSYPEIVAKKLSPLDPAVIHVGMISGGSARNAIADNVSFHGTVRTFSKEVFSTIQNEIKSLHESMEIKSNTKINWSLEPMYPPVINDHTLSNMLIELLDESIYVDSRPRMTAEDFSFYGDIAPSLFVLVGTKNKALNLTAPLHNPKFNFTSKPLITGFNAFKSLVDHLIL